MSQSISRNADRLRNSLLIHGMYLTVTVVLNAKWLLLLPSIVLVFCYSPVFAYGERLLKCWTEQSSSDFGMGTRAVKTAK